MTIRRTQALSLFLLLLVPAGAFAQALPTTQPAFLRIIREDVKPGHAADHTVTEAHDKIRKLQKLTGNP